MGFTLDSKTYYNLFCNEKPDKGKDDTIEGLLWRLKKPNSSTELGLKSALTRRGNL